MYRDMTSLLLYSTPVEGIPMHPEEVVPGSEEILLGYELLELSTFTQPHPSEMNWVGWTAVTALLILFWPLACVPCFLGCSYPVFQRAVYGPRGRRVIYRDLSE